MNDIDKQIVNLLSLDGRTSNAELARKIGLTAPSVAERIRRLEDIGVVAGFSLKVEPKALGFPLAAYIRIRPMPGNHRIRGIYDNTRPGCRMPSRDRRRLLYRHGSFALD